MGDSVRCAIYYKRSIIYGCSPDYKHQIIDFVDPREAIKQHWYVFNNTPSSSILNRPKCPERHFFLTSVMRPTRPCSSKMGNKTCLLVLWTCWTFLCIRNKPKPSRNGLNCSPESFMGYGPLGKVLHFLLTGYFYDSFYELKKKCAISPHPPWN